MLNLPNTLTLLRIIAIPTILILLEHGRHGLAFWLFVAAGVTDALDGGIARMTNTRTALGSYLDPLADKGLVLTLLVALTLLGHIPGWVITIILTRDVVCILGYGILFVLTGERLEILPTLVGKLATFLQLAGLASTLFLLRDGGPAVAAAHGWLVPIFAAAAVATAISGVQYVSRGLQWYQTRPPGEVGRVP